MTDDAEALHSTPSSLLANTQRSHLLLVLSNPCEGGEAQFRQWYRGEYRSAVQSHASVLHTRQFERHPVDVTGGQWPAPPFQYLAAYDLRIDGAQQAEPLIERISELHMKESAASAPAAWLYYPASERVGAGSPPANAMATIAFANGVADREEEFREFYATRHIRHALLVPALYSGQCFKRTTFQVPGAQPADFDTIAIYDSGTPEEILDGFAVVPEGALNFPTLDLKRFSEGVYCLLDDAGGAKASS